MPEIDLPILRRDSLALAERVDRHAVEVLVQQISYQNEGHRIALHALSVRMLQTCRAVVTLVEEHLHDGAAAVLRSLVEQHFVFSALHKNPALLEQARKEEEGEQRKALGGLTKLPADLRAEEMSDEVLHEAMAQRGTAGFDVWAWAKRADLEPMYQSLWRHLSFNAHGALHAINEYVVVAEDEQTILGIRKTVLPERSIDFVLTAIQILMACVCAIDRQPMTEQRRARRELIGKEWSGLYDQYFQVADEMFRMSEAVSQPIKAEGEGSL